MLLGLRNNPYRELERRIGYSFRKRALLEAALTHRSFRFETADVSVDNQRLEFLGDAVLGLVTAAHIYREFEGENEGRLTDLRSMVASGKALAGIAQSIDLGSFLRLGRGEEQAGGRRRGSLLADGMEAIIGAAFLDGGMRAAEKIFAALFASLLGAGHQPEWVENPKGRLQELVQRELKGSVHYRCISEEGPAHQKTFTVEARIRGIAMGVGAGANRRTAETQAAIQAYQALKASRKDLKISDTPSRS